MKIPLLLLSTALLLLLPAAPAAALQILDPEVRCGVPGMPVAPGQVIDVPRCGDSLVLSFIIGGFPTPEPTLLALTLTVDGQVVQTLERELPADLGPVWGFCGICPIVNGVEHYWGMGTAVWLEPQWGSNRVVPALARLVVDGDAADVAFQVTATPEPATLLTFGASLAGLGLWVRMRRGR